MGADLIVFIAKGPVTFSEANRKKALRRATRIHKAANTLLALLKSPQDEDSMIAANTLFEDELFCEAKEQYCIEEVEDFENYFPLKDPNALMKEFLDWWGSFDGRDTSGRPDPDDPKQQIVVCGEMSWGDIPEGYGYTMMREAYCYDIPQSLGIR